MCENIWPGTCTSTVRGSSLFRGLARRPPDALKLLEYLYSIAEYYWYVGCMNSRSNFPHDFGRL